MNKLHKKKGTTTNSKYLPGANPEGRDIPSTTELYYKKLNAYLLLLYQTYLRGETVLEAEIKMAIWRMVLLNKDFHSKIKMLHLDYLKKDITNLDAPWEEAEDILFPMEESIALKSLNKGKVNLIKEYKDAVSALLASNP